MLVLTDTYLLATDEALFCGLLELFSRAVELYYNEDHKIGFEDVDIVTLVENVKEITGAQHRRDAEDHAFNLFFVDLQIQPYEQPLDFAPVLAKPVESWLDYQGH